MPEQPREPRETEFKPYLRTIRDLLNATYGDFGGKAEIAEDGETVEFAQVTPDKDDPKMEHYIRVGIGIRSLLTEHRPRST